MWLQASIAEPLIAPFSKAIAPARAALCSLATLVWLTGSAGAQQSPIAPPPSGVVPVPAPFGSDDPDNPLVAPVPPPSGDPSRNPAGAGDGVANVEISSDLSLLPAPVRRMRELIMEAALSGDPEKLRPLIGSGANTTRLSLADVEGDPIEYFKSISGDPEGHEMLAILLEVFEAGYARLDAGTENELYVWPYFFAKSLEGLTPEQRVELFKLVTAGDYEDMTAFGAYIFFRAGITPEGRWLFFVAGD